MTKITLATIVTLGLAFMTSTAFADCEQIAKGLFKCDPPPPPVNRTIECRHFGEYLLCNGEIGQPSYRGDDDKKIVTPANCGWKNKKYLCR